MEKIIDCTPYILWIIFFGLVATLVILDFKDSIVIKKYCFNNSNTYAEYERCRDIPKEEILFIIRKDKKDVYN